MTFACMNQLTKVTPAMTRLWGTILEQVPRSRLLVLVEPGCVNDAEILRLLAEGGVGRTQLERLPRRSRQNT